MGGYFLLIFLFSQISAWAFKLPPTSRLQPLSLRNKTKSSNSRLGAAKGGGGYDFDVIIIGAGVGGHAAALHSVSNKKKTLLVTGSDLGGTCVNRGCVPSKALLAASGRIRAMRDTANLKSMGITLSDVQFRREGLRDHANDLVSKVRGGMRNSLKNFGVELVERSGKLQDTHTIQLFDKNDQSSPPTKISAANIILAPGSLPLVPKGIEVDEKTVFTSDGGLQLPSVPDWLAIIGSGYIGLEFADVFTALGSEVTFIEAADKLMPAFEPEIAKLANRLLINPRAVDSRTGVFASSVKCGKPGERPVTIELVDTRTRTPVETLQVDACMVATGRRPNTQDLGMESVGVELQRGGFVPVDEHMNVLTKGGEKIPNIFCIGDANGKMMLAHAASAQGISAVQNLLGKTHVVNHQAIPAACFTHPEIAFVGLKESEAVGMGKEEGFEVGKATGHFRANSKALAEGQAEGVVIIYYRKDTGLLLGAHLIGPHVSDLVQQASNAIAAEHTVQQLAFMVHTHPTLSEVMETAYKQAVGIASH